MKHAKKNELDDIFAGLDSDLDQAKMVDDVIPPDGRLMTAPEAIAFMTAGNATFTVRSVKTGNRFTFRVRSPRDNEGKVDHNAPVKFVQLLNGSDNVNSFVYMGYIKRGVYYHGGAKSRAGSRDTPSNTAFEWVWRKLAQGQLPDTLEIWHEGKCGRCGRKLTVPSSIRSGLGPECASK